MDKSKALATLFLCAEQYHDNLENNNLLFIYGSTKKIEYIETGYFPRHFLHLTGVDYIKSPGSSEFYRDCLDKRLSLNDFALDNNGLAEMKLSILSQLMNIHKTARAIGDYDYSNQLLITEKLAGTITACMGFVENEGFYVPNTALKGNIKDYSNNTKQVVAVYRKPISQEKYTENCYLAKGITENSLVLPKEISDKIKTQNQPKVYHERVSIDFVEKHFKEIANEKNKDVIGRKKEELER